MAACKVGRLIGNTHTLTRGDRATLRAWLDTRRDGKGRQVSADVMAQALTADGHGVGPTTLKDHRGRRCVCWRERTTP
jgi:hypothetical protein